MIPNIVWFPFVELWSRCCDTTRGGFSSSLVDTFQIHQNRAAGVIANMKYEDTDYAKLLTDLN